MGDVLTKDSIGLIVVTHQLTRNIFVSFRTKIFIRLPPYFAIFCASKKFRNWKTLAISVLFVIRCVWTAIKSYNVQQSIPMQISLNLNLNAISMLYSV